MEQVMVSIICTSYNYEKFISKAIDSFLSQKTNFLYEILIVDDCSTDHSVTIIEEYQKKYPKLIRFYRNEVNKGLTKTWIDICKLAKGKYIARCDADDYWIDDQKLQKQVDILESNDQSKWCNTSFNIVDENDNVIYEDVFKNGPILYANTYEKMLATKGMTLTSSWLIETNLMNNVNARIDPDSVDDGFPMQLEFFKETVLSFIPDSTVAYRMTSNSDSRPNDDKKMLDRINGLLKTQLEYLDKYPEMDMFEMVKILVTHDKNQEIRIYNFSKEINQLLTDNFQKSDTLNKIIQENKNLSIENTSLKTQIEHFEKQINMITNSKRWKITSKIINFFRRNR